MKTTLLKFTGSICGIILLLAAFSTASCKKDQTCRGTVYVNDSSNNKVGGAVVQLDAMVVGGQLILREKTDANGEAHFDVKLPAIFNVTATHDSFPLKYGKGVLNLDEARKINYVTVKLQ
jgi:hypothetical protein